jgi:hypothetical protein
MGGVENDRLPLPVLVAEQAREPLIRALGQAAGVLGGEAGLRIEMDVEVLGPQDVEVEGPILDLVLSEVVLGGEHRRRAGEEGNSEDETTAHDNTCSVQAPGVISGASLQRRSSW